MVIYSVSWDCNEDYTRAVVSIGGDYDVQLFSGQGRVAAAPAAVQDLPGRAIYEAVYIPDFFLLRVFALEGRSLQVDSKTVRVGDSCTGQRVYVTYGGPAAAEAAQPPPPEQREQPPPERQERGAGPFAGGLDPSAYVARYAADEAYRQWYDENHAPEYGSICAAVGLDEGCVERHLASEGALPGQASGDRPAPEAPEAGADAAGDGEERPPAAPPGPDGGGAEDGDPGPAPPEPAPAEPGGPGGGGCLVATAAYGSELAPQVQALREMRDAAMSGGAYGAPILSALSTAYYAASPAVSDLERAHPWFRDAVRAAIAPSVAALSAVATEVP